MANRVDDNQRDIVKTFRDIGFSVLILSDVGKGCPDILVGFRGMNYLVEIKDGAKSPSKQRLTPHEDEFHQSWRGQVIIIRSINEVLKFVSTITRPA